MGEPALYELKRASLRGPLGRALAPLDLTIRDGVATALVGPVGSGKSALLRLLSGRPPYDGWEVDGTWCFRGRDLQPGGNRRRPLDEVAWVPQIRNPPMKGLSDARELDAARARIDGAFFRRPSVVLLDEPTRGLTDEDRASVVERLREHTRTGAAIVISHDQDFIQAFADDICMLCDGELVMCGTAEEFFGDQQQEELVRQFVDRGTCAYNMYIPPLPRHFHWHQAGKLAGMGRPGLLRDLDDDLFAIAYAGITLLVGLTEHEVPSERLRPFGIAGRHFPIRDMGIPAVRDAIALCHDLIRAMERGQVVAVHCHAGLGRTGTILASIAVCQGMGAAEAIDAVRSVTPSAIQTEEQEAFVHEVEARR